MTSCRRATDTCGFAHVIPEPASVKDAIEALGVPHPEVDVMLINGESADFAYRLGDGDDVSRLSRIVAR